MAVKSLPIILVTQPDSAAKSLLQALNSEEFQTRHYPAFEIVYLCSPSLPTVAPSFIIVTSPNAVAGALRAGIVLPNNIPYFAVGKGSAVALRSIGASPIYIANPAGSEGLLALPELHNLSPNSGWILTGKGGRGLLEKELPKLRLPFSRIETYQRKPRNQPASLSAALKSKPQLAIATSLETLDNLARISDAASSVVLGQCHWLVSSARIANTLCKHWPNSTHTITTGPDADALLLACKQWTQEHKRHGARRRTTP